MAWSTRQLAELAGTSVRAVRYYHEVGLLAEPERRANGYKRYGVAHLIRVLRIKRLTDLGFSLSEIAAMGDVGEYPEAALRTLDAELATTIERLQRVRVELALILRQATPTDLPRELAVAAADASLSDADRAFMVVVSRVLGPSALTVYAEMLQTHPGEPEFDSLPADADEQTRHELAERLLPVVRDLFVQYPQLQDLAAGAPGGARFAERTLGVAIRDVYNTAQVDVLRRVGKGLQKPIGTDH